MNKKEENIALQMDNFGKASPLDINVSSRQSLTQLKGQSSSDNFVDLNTGQLNDIQEY